MRRIQKWLAGLSLAQQLISIILCSSIVFFLLFFVYVRSSITTIAATQTYEMLESWQDFVISTYKKGGYNYENYEASQYEVSHVVFKKGKQVDFIGTYLHDQDMSMAYNMIMNNPTGQRRGYSAFQSAHTIYYLLGEIDNNTQILSFVDRSYANAIENTLFTSVSNISAVVVALLFVLLLLWVTSLLHPLNQIRTYIEKIRNGEDPTLQIDRSDEIGEVAFALVNMREELKKQDEIKEEMIHNISHDLKTPIATIKSYGESIKDGIYPYETLEKSVDVIIENADRLERKVHSLLFLNRLDYLLSSSEHVIVDIDMKELVNSVLLSLKVIRPEITITTELEEIKFRGDDESWRVLVENLVDNGLRYAEHNVHIVLKQGYLSVTNDGPSISKERMDKLFKPFEKGSKGKFGLGLSICYKVANAYGYSIEAVNMENGVRFVVNDKNAPKKDRFKMVTEGIRTKIGV